ncbi:MAG: bifunctional 5,10-methylenetetrahydrofolate dehydrogenase/5,10-methenyltetrahydrofolate cyclohydrolase [Candidatus Aminicenantes bacterium]|jgi:methylenetetrahydrofolate dehydrogenase (NADP+)/methenyltetrahydrofolate cyclohydrolase
MGEWLEGKSLAMEIRERVKTEVAGIREETDDAPGLAAVLVGENRASQIYVRMKQRASEKLGIASEVVTLPTDTQPASLRETIEELNVRNDVDGILVQLPLPSHLSSYEAITTIRPEKDVDGIHPVSLGNLLMNEQGLRPATPTGIMELIKSRNIAIEGQRVVIIGRSLIVGKPLAAMMTNAHGTVTVCHSRTKDLPRVAAEADILVAAMGKPAFVTPEFIKEGATVVDVGTSQLEDREKAMELFGPEKKRMEDFEKKGYTVVGDVHPKAIEKAAFVTPVPGGIGPLTIALLMRNTLDAFKNRRSRKAARVES